MTAELETVLADMREEANTLRRNKAAFSVERVEEFADLITLATEEWTTFISEGEASIRSGRTEATIRAKYDVLAREGHARERNGRRQYRECMIPRRAQIDEAAERGRAAARAVADEREKKAS